MVDAELNEVDQILFDQKKAKMAKKGIVMKSKEEKRVARRAREKARKNKKKGKGGGEASEDIVDFGDFKERGSIKLLKTPFLWYFELK